MYLVLAWTSHLPPSSDDVASVSLMEGQQQLLPFRRTAANTYSPSLVSGKLRTKIPRRSRTVSVRAREGSPSSVREELGSWATTPARPFHQITARSPLPAGPAPRPFLPAAGRCACATQERRCKSRTYSPSSKSNLS
jgi:hypothetical protein